MNARCDRRGSHTSALRSEVVLPGFGGQRARTCQHVHQHIHIRAGTGIDPAAGASLESRSAAASAASTPARAMGPSPR
ncbi:hypothetical protein [Nocardia pseudovaccinii]|uniref:hypothetical protein n=1 Tax=Nocardia pseudovaccinii TaxID=189540 RepID=UPI0012F4A809|nr:hypothetical protein [Nocardia pseudovaccinii]